MLKLDKDKRWYVVINRKQKRELRKDKNLIIELYAIIKKYIPELFDKFNELTDIRNQSYATYNMKTICVARLFGLICGLASITSISDKLNTENAINNISNICNQKLKLKIKEVSIYLLNSLTSTTSDLNNLNTNFQLRFDD